jgi:type I restriction enzyme, S subunit
MKRYDSYKDSGIEWIGEIPLGWELMTVRRITQDHKQGYYSPEGYKEDGHKLVRITDLDANGNIDTSTSPFVSPTEKELEVFEIKKGDILFPRTGSVGLVGVAKNDMKAVFASYLIRFRFSDKTENSFMRYYFISEAFLNGLFSDLHGGVNQNIHAENIKDQWISLPSLLEQTTIANYLDQKTTQLDDLIAKKERLIQLLEEERTAIINQAVTKGLDPTVPMKDSGIEWLGEIPEHWEVKSFRFCIDVLTDYTANGSFASLAENVTYYDSGYSRLVRLTDLRVHLENDGLYVDEHAHNFLKKSELFGGELLIANVGAYAGLVMEMPRIEGKYTLGPNMFLLRLNQNTDFFVSQLNAPFCAEQLKMMAVSSAQPKLNKENIRQLKVVTPPIEEQEAIVDYIKSMTNEIDSLNLKTLQEIDLLKEYKTALISEVVTGKVCVRDENLN